MGNAAHYGLVKRKVESNSEIPRINSEEQKLSYPSVSVTSSRVPCISELPARKEISAGDQTRYELFYPRALVKYLQRENTSEWHSSQKGHIDKYGKAERRDSPGKHALNSTNNTNNTRPNASDLPAELSPLMQSPGLVPQHAAQGDDNSGVGSDETLGLAVREGREARQQPVVGAGGPLLGRLLLLAGLVAGRLLLLLALDAVPLRVRLHGLLHEVGGDGAHRLRVDVDEAACRGGYGLVGDDLRGLGGGGLGVLRGMVSLQFSRRFVIRATVICRGRYVVGL